MLNTLPKAPSNIAMPLIRSKYSQPTPAEVSPPHIPSATKVKTPPSRTIMMKAKRMNMNTVLALERALLVLRLKK